MSKLKKSHKAKPNGNSPEALVSLIERQLEDDKAIDPVIIDLKGKSDMADYMVVASGTSNRHIGAMAEHLVDKCKAKGVRPIATEGMPNCEWVLIDNPYVIVHLFRTEARQHYNLEKMWLV